MGGKVLGNCVRCLFDPMVDPWVYTFCFLCLQELERRFAVWMDNLHYVLEYNSKHSSHWVSQPGNHVGVKCAGKVSVVAVYF